MNKTGTLIYFAARGRGELIRIVLGGVEYAEEPVEAPKLLKGTGRLPFDERRLLRQRRRAEATSPQRQ